MPQPSRRAFRPSNFTRSRGLRSFQALLLNLNDELAFVLAWVMQLSDSPEEQHFSFGGKYPPITPKTRLLFCELRAHSNYNILCAGIFLLVRLTLQLSTEESG